MIQTVRTKDFEMDYFSFGNGGRTLVIIPGLSIKSVMLSEEAVKAAYDCFTKDFTVYLFDRRKQIGDTYSIQEMARDTVEAIAALGLKKFSLFGTSQGGMIAQYIAIEHPQLVEKLILGSTSSRSYPDAGEKGTSSTAAEKTGIADGTTEDIVSGFADKCYSQEFLARFKPMFMQMHSDLTQEELRRFKVLAAGIGTLDTYDRLGEIQCPVFVIGSMKDKMLPPAASIDIAEKLRSLGKECKLFMYEGYSHAVYDEAPDYKARMMEFLA